MFNIKKHTTTKHTEHTVFVALLLAMLAQLALANKAGINVESQVGLAEPGGYCTPNLGLASNPAVPPVPDQAAASIRVAIHGGSREISPTLWGIFFEDINFGADGGLYAEMVKNRSFEFPDSMMGWIPLGPSVPSGTMAIRNDAPFSAASPHYLRIESQGKKGYTGLFGVANEGFRGMGVRAGEAYRFSAQVRQATGKSKLRVELFSAEGLLLDKVQMEGFSDGWKQYSAVLHPKQTDAKAKLHLYIEDDGGLDLDMVSLFPEKTWKNRPGGLRADLVQLLADLKPGFLRFPGGCIVEGVNLAGRYQWKNTLGAPEERKLLRNRWSNEFPGRVTPDYFQSLGLGFFEYFQLCEDIGAEPLPLLNCGMACQFNTGELAPLDQLGPYIQDALDLIEFANGPAGSPWGSRRASLGHPAPFRMKFLGVGNENWGPDYVERYAAFAKALKARHPEITLVASAGPSPSDQRFAFMWDKLRELKADVVDEHSYGAPKWFYDSVTRYDQYPRTGPKVCVGEYAARGKGARNTWEMALAEAAFMTGLERNGDIIQMSAYAPLLAHVDAWQWHPDLIWFDNLRACPTPNYQVQKLFSTNRGDAALPVQASGANFYVSATVDKRAGEIVLKVVNASAKPRPTAIVLDGAKQIQSTGRAILLSGSLEEETSPDKLSGICAKDSTLGDVAPKFRHLFPPHSVSVLRLKEKAQP